ncbi:MAG TPA: efflux RND transporter periplasmic adaptor subunit [Tepidisphaeraceae bacterium]|nr:efflux RND transporter periplasmic adaptor subunit [Tepidisphaeraceae bacterium]
MKVVWNLFLVVLLMAAAGFAGYFIGHRGVTASAPEVSDDSSDDPIPAVRTVPIQQTRIEQKMIAYGVVTAQPADMTILSLPFESQVKKVLVVPGQRLAAETPVIEIEPSTDTQLQMLQAKAAVLAAAADIRQTRQRYSAHLATNQDLLQSEQNQQMARLKLDSLEKQGAGGAEQLKASGLVAKVDVQDGQIVPAGSPLLEVAAPDKLEVRLGIEPSDVSELHVGDAVLIRPINSDASPMHGKVMMIAQRIDPETRLSDVSVSLPADAAVPLDTSVSGELTVASADALVVPRSAVLPGDDGYSLFTVDHDKAAEHKVILGVRNDDAVQVVGDGLAAGQAVVILGNLELEDGMTVKTVDSPTTQEAAQ